MKSNKFKVFFITNTKSLVHSTVGTYFNILLKFNFFVSKQLVYLLLDACHKINAVLFNILWIKFTIDATNEIYVIKDKIVFNTVGRKSKYLILNLDGLKKFFIEHKSKFSICLLNYKSFLDSLNDNIKKNNLELNKSELLPFLLFDFLKRYHIDYYLEQAGIVLKKNNIMYILQLKSKTIGMFIWYGGQTSHQTLAARFADHPYFHNLDFIQIWACFYIQESPAFTITNSAIALEDSLFSALSLVLSKHKLIISSHLNDFSCETDQQRLSHALNLVFLDKNVNWNSSVIAVSPDILQQINQSNYNKL